MWSILEKVIDWAGRHKLLTAGIAAGAGYLVVSKTASAANVLPGTVDAKATSNGGIASSVAVLEPPKLVNTTQTVLRVTTRDPMPQGMLNARANDQINPDGSPAGAKIGYWPKDGLVRLLAPGDNGFVYVEGPGVGPAGEAQVKGWAAQSYLQPAN